jgi:hypothetical protein
MPNPLCQRCKKPVSINQPVCHALCTWPVPDIVEKTIRELENSVTVALIGFERFSIPRVEALREIQRAFRVFEGERAKWPH